MQPKSDYRDALNDTWQQHLIPKPPNAPSVISLFAGCGGSSLGYSMAGFQELLAVEWDKNAVETFKLNFPEVPVFHGNIATLSVDDCLTLTKLKPRELDVLDGSPPCQGFSTAGKRDIRDSRNQLFREYVRLLRGLRPRMFVMENVSGVVKGLMRLIFVEVLKELKASGYQVKARLLNAMYYGVPQSRERMIIIGIRNDLNIVPRHPTPTSRPITVREAIGHIPLGNLGKYSPQVIAAWHRSKGNQSLRHVDRLVGSFQSVRLDPDKPSPTQIKSHYNWRWDAPRQLLPLEAGLLSSFSEKWQWVGGRNSIKQRIGNAVPPLFMREIALHVHRLLEQGNLIRPLQSQTGVTL